MKQYEVTGSTSRSRKTTLVVDAIDKQEVWNDPSSFGFRKIFRVEEKRKLIRGNLESMYT